MDKKQKITPEFLPMNFQTFYGLQVKNDPVILEFNLVSFF